MRIFIVFLTLLQLVTVSCNRKGTTEQDQATDSIQTPQGRIISAIGEPLIPEAREAVENWKEYHDVDAMVKKYYSISVSEALTNAAELSELVTFMQDSIRVEELDRPNVLARIHVFRNQTLRLADMASIPAITDEEVKAEVEKILEVYDAFHSKINTIYSASAIQESLEVDTETPVEAEEPQKLVPQPKVSSKTG
jgi:hypothetical protein